MAETKEAAKQTDFAAKGSKELELKDAYGNSVGTVLMLGEPDNSLDGLAKTASRVKGWKGLTVDGEAQRYSKESAVALLGRFSHFAQQVEKA